MEIVELINSTLSFISALVPIFIWTSIWKFMRNQERHNSAVEMRLDVLVREIKKLTAEE